MYTIVILWEATEFQLSGKSLQWQCRKNASYFLSKYLLIYTEQYVHFIIWKITLMYILV